MTKVADGHVRTAHPVQGLPSVVRHITGQDAEGRSVFLSTDSNEHHPELINETAIANIIYPTKQHPVEFTGDADTRYTYENEPCITSENGSVCRIVDLAPGGASPMLRVNNLDYAVVIEGVLKMILDSGEERIMRRGEVAVQRSTTHRWVNVTGNGLLPGRLLLVQLNDVHKGGEKRQRELDVRRTDYVSAKGTYFYGDEFFESEF